MQVRFFVFVYCWDITESCCNIKTHFGFLRERRGSIFELAINTQSSVSHAQTLTHDFCAIRHNFMHFNTSSQCLLWRWTISAHTVWIWTLSMFLNALRPRPSILFVPPDFGSIFRCECCCFVCRFVVVFLFTSCLCCCHYCYCYFVVVL